MTLLNNLWNASENSRANETNYMFDTGYLRVGRVELNEKIENQYKLVMSNGPVEFRNVVNGEVISINYEKLFLRPPQDLKGFLPNDFDKDKITERKFTLDGQEKEMKFRNYGHGRATSWNVGHYKKWFPSVKTNEDVFAISRVLSFSGGNWLKIAN